jgi:2-dehydro-3-deoxyphosphogluconate aldolase/(4S)-4-hydroxy-2-oxoglutarate aldolase
MKAGRRCKPFFPCTVIKNEICQRLIEPGIIAILRADSSEHLVAIAGALYEGGVKAVEITMTTPNALQIISDVVAQFAGRILMGVGTVLDPETCRAAILAGAEFVVTPVTKPDVIRLANRYGKPIASGAFTPTEALLGYESGADFIKLFPADHVGPSYVKTILAPLPMLQIIPTGGVTPETAGDYIRAGCVALGAGSTLVSKEAMKTGDLKAITKRAEEFVRAVGAARAGKGKAGGS